MEKRTKEIKIRLTDNEFLELMQRKTKAKLAEWVRLTALNQPVRKVIKQVDSNLLYELNKIGTNLNQIARQLNAQKSKDTGACYVALVEIENMLKQVLEAHNDS